MMTLKRIATLMIGNTISSLAITMLMKSGFGCFSVTCANLALSNWTGLTVGTTGMIIELIMLMIATYKGEGVGLTSLTNAIYGSLMIDVFLAILPESPYMVLGLPLISIGWMMIGSAGYGDTGSNTLMNAILKNTKLSMGTVRGIQECILLIVGYIGARDSVSIFTLILSLGLGKFLEKAYSVLHYDPTTVKHQYLIKRSS